MSLLPLDAPRGAAGFQLVATVTLESAALAAELISVLFFGGWLGPVLPGAVWLLAKTFFFVCLFILVRGALPRPRYDQIMDFGWKVCLPLTLVNLMATAAIVLWRSHGSPF